MLFISLLFFACGDAEEKSTTVDVQKKTEVVQPSAPDASAKTPSENSGNTQCDKQLKEYSDFVDEYIALMEKAGPIINASTGDLSALRKYPALLEKTARSLELDVLHKDGTIDANCWKRYNEINSRLTNAVTKSAAMDMNGAITEDKEEMKKLKEIQDKAVDQAACLQKCQEDTDPMAAATCIQDCM